MIDVAGAVEAGVVEAVGVASMEVGTVVAEASVVVEGGVVVVTRAEGSNLVGVEHTRNERRQSGRLSDLNQFSYALPALLSQLLLL